MWSQEMWMARSAASCPILTGGPYLSSRASIWFDRIRPLEMGLVVSESASSSVVDLLQLNIQVFKTMSKKFIPEARFGAFESTLESNNSFIGEIESQLASCNSKLKAAAENLSSTKCSLRFAEDAVAVMSD